MSHWIKPAKQVCSSLIPAVTHPPAILLLHERTTGSGLVLHLLSSDELWKQAYSSLYVLVYLCAKVEVQASRA